MGTIFKTSEFYVYGNFEVELVALIADSYEIIAIFLWKQVIQIILRRNMSTTITRPLRIVWTG